MEVSPTGLLPRRCAQLQFPRDGLADVVLTETAFVESTRSPMDIPRRWCVPFPIDGIFDVDMAGTSLLNRFSPDQTIPDLTIDNRTLSSEEINEVM
jgi:hypothetical protein